MVSMLSANTTPKSAEILDIDCLKPLDSWPTFNSGTFTKYPSRRPGHECTATKELVLILESMNALYGFEVGSADKATAAARNKNVKQVGLHLTHL